MRPSKYLIGITAICTAGVLAVACSSGSKKSGSFALDTGDYNLVGTDVTGDTCFNATLDGIIKSGTALPFHIDVTSSTQFTLGPQAGTTIGNAIKAFLPPLNGTKAGNALTLTAAGHYFLTSNCSLGFATSPTATGTMTAKDAFSVTIPLTITAETTNAAYTTLCPAVVQSAFAQATSGFVPWPALSGANHETGSCGITIDGNVSLQ